MKQLSEELETAYTTGNEIVHNHDADFLRGEQLLILAAEVGHADAAALLATIYFDDFCSSGTFRMGGPAWWGKRQDYPLGLTYLNLAVALNHGMSRLTMAHFLLHGKEELGLEVDFHKGMELLDQLDRENFLPALLYKYDMVSQRVIPVEDVLKVATQDSIDQSILALLERASGLGDAKTSFQLAQFYFGCNDRIDGYLPEATIDIEKGMHYLHLSLTQGHLNAAFLLSDIYQVKTDSAFLSKIKSIPFNIQHDPVKALQALLAGYRIADSDHNKAQCAYAIAKLYLTNERLGSADERRAECTQYYEIAAKLGHDDAIAEYGILLLTGNSLLGLAPDPDKSDRTFHLASCRAYNKIQREIARSTSYSPENMSRYLYWIFKAAERTYDYSPLTNALNSLHYLLDTGHTRAYSGEDGILSSNANKALAERCKLLLKDPFLQYSWEFTRDKEQVAFMQGDFPAFTRAVYAHFKLECPFDDAFFSPVTPQYDVTRVPNPANPARFITIHRGTGQERINPCLLFSGRSFRQDVPERVDRSERQVHSQNAESSDATLSPCS